MMAKYRKKPVVIEAERWGGLEGWEGVVLLPPPDGIVRRWWRRGWWIKTLEGWYRVRPGNWIITGVKGERYPCDAEIFSLTYDAVKES